MAKKSALTKITEEITANIDALTELFDDHETKKKSAREARGITVELGKQLKVFRKVSVAHFK